MTIENYFNQLTFEYNWKRDMILVLRKKNEKNVTILDRDDAQEDKTTNKRAAASSLLNRFG